VHIDGRSNATGPAFEIIQFRIRKDGALDIRNEFRKRTDVHADSLATGSDGFDERRASANMRIKTDIAGFGEGRNCSTREAWAETRWVLVVSVSETPDRAVVTRAGN
jgi:hypothetical protein